MLCDPSDFSDIFSLHPDGKSWFGIFACYFAIVDIKISILELMFGSIIACSTSPCGLSLERLDEWIGIGTSRIFDPFSLDIFQSLFVFFETGFEAEGIEVSKAFRFLKCEKILFLEPRIADSATSNFCSLCIHQERKCFGIEFRKVCN